MVCYLVIRAKSSWNPRLPYYCCCSLFHSHPSCYCFFLFFFIHWTWSKNSNIKKSYILVGFFEWERKKKEKPFGNRERKWASFFHKDLVFLDTGYCGIPLKIGFFLCVSANPVFIYWFLAQLELFQVRMFRWVFFLFFVACTICCATCYIHVVMVCVFLVRVAQLFHLSMILCIWLCLSTYVMVQILARLVGIMLVGYLIFHSYLSGVFYV